MSLILRETYSAASCGGRPGTGIRPCLLVVLCLAEAVSVLFWTAGRREPSAGPGRIDARLLGFQSVPSPELIFAHFGGERR